MKANSYIRFFALAGLAVAATACDENSWNDHLDGFDEFENKPTTQVETVEYTLTDADYGTIAGLSENIALAGTEGAKALKAVGDQKRFSEAAGADMYVPAYLASTSFPYFTLNDGSAVKLTYNMAVGEPEDFVDAGKPQKYTVTEEQYKNKVWTPEHYCYAIAPSMDPVEIIPGLLGDVDGEENPFCVVSYNLAVEEPVFDDDADVLDVLLDAPFNADLCNFSIDNVEKPAEIENVWAWGGANYGAKATAFSSSVNYKSESWLISPVIDLGGHEGAMMSFEQATNFFASVEAAKDEATVWIREEDGEWSQITGYDFPASMSWSFVSSGDIDISDFDGKKIQIAFKYTSDTKAGTWEVKNVKVMSVPLDKGRIDVESELVRAMFYWNGSEWTGSKTDYIFITNEDYKVMGQKYSNLPSAEPYLSTWLGINYAYALADDMKYVIWTKYADGKSSDQCSAYKYDGSVWKPYSFVEEKTSQFVRTGGKWMFDPNVTITLPAGKNQEMSTKYFQACVDWVFENICKPLGDTDIKSNKFYISKYGNNEYYSGTSAFQGNVDLRADAARTQYAAGYEGMTDQEIIDLEKKRFMEETMPGALGMIHPEAEPLAGFDVLYTINFSAYEYDEVEKKNLTNEYTAVFKVTGKGKFEPVSCTWGYPAE